MPTAILDLGRLGRFLCQWGTGGGMEYRVWGGREFLPLERCGSKQDFKHRLTWQLNRLAEEKIADLARDSSRLSLPFYTFEESLGALGCPARIRLAYCFRQEGENRIKRLESLGLFIQFKERWLSSAYWIERVYQHTCLLLPQGFCKTERSG